MQLITDTDLTAQRSACASKLRHLRAAHPAMDEQIAAETATLDGIEMELRQRKLVAAQAAARYVDWAQLLIEGLGMPHHRQRHRELAALGLFSTGYFPETMQRCVCIQMHPSRVEVVDELAASLEVLMPHVKPLPDGWCAMNIIARSHEADYQLRFLPDLSQFQVASMRLRSPEIEITSSDLREVLAHIQRHHHFFEPTLGATCF